MSILIDTLLDRIKREFLLHEPKWEEGTIEEYDLQFLNEECNKDSEFDPSNKRKKMFKEMMKGNKIVVKSKCEYGQVLAVFESAEQLSELPWGLWARILRLFSEKGKKPFKVFFLATESLRKFPHNSEPIISENINGGYTYRCNPETILIYRAEDATRVLIHELQHSCCLDKIENCVDLIEAETEAWAELLYIAILSRGQQSHFEDLLNKQSEWMVKQNSKVRKHMTNPTSREFPWRYTIGKEEVWRRWGILKENKGQVYLGDSLRLTYPPNNKLKEQFKVIKESTIL
jgi:hypothetical protein